MIYEKILKKCIKDNKIDEVCTFIRSLEDKDSAIDWLINYMKKTKSTKRRNTIAIVLSELHCKKAISTLLELIEKYAYPNNYATLIYALSNFNHSDYLNRVFRLIYLGNFEAREFVFEIFKNSYLNISELDKSRFKDELKEYIEDCKDRLDILMTAQSLIE
ncbi:MAG: hypothetical protein J6O50_11005 [Ruminiclostridium sp.]|nr:hypothetical protein [Ruminiclostridium sp.]